MHLGQFWILALQSSTKTNQTMNCQVEHLEEEEFEGKLQNSITGVLTCTHVWQPLANGTTLLQTHRMPHNRQDP